MAFTITLNGTPRSVESEAGTPLLWVLRDELGLTGTKYGCGVAACGACTVHLDGVAVRSCQTMIEDVGAAEVTTIEGLSGPIGDALRAAWSDLDVVQCGYCQPGQIMQAAGLLAETPRPGPAEIEAALAGNACRCATYTRIRAAVVRAAELLEG